MELAFLGTECVPARVFLKPVPQTNDNENKRWMTMKMRGVFYLKSVFQNQLGSGNNLLNYKRKSSDCNFCRKWQESSVHHHRVMLKGHISHLVLVGILSYFILSRQALLIKQNQIQVPRPYSLFIAAYVSKSGKNFAENAKKGWNAIPGADPISSSLSKKLTAFIYCLAFKISFYWKVSHSYIIQVQSSSPESLVRGH